MTQRSTTTGSLAKRNGLLLWTLIASVYIGSDAAAQPEVILYGHFTDRFGPNSIPRLPVGDKVQVFAFVDSADPIASPTISVEAVQGDTTLALIPFPPESPIYEGFHLYYTFIDFDPALTGPWRITPTDSTGTGRSIYTHGLLEPEFLPLVEDITVHGTPYGASVSWTVPDLEGFDVDGSAIRIFESVSGRQLWGSNTLPLSTTSFDLPADALENLQYDIEYVYRIGLGDLIDPDGFYFENTSKAFSKPFLYGRFPDTIFGIAGDYNNNGQVEQADLDLVLLNWGQELIDPFVSGWFSDLPSGIIDQQELDKVLLGWGSIISLGAATSGGVPEPSTLVLALFFAASCALYFRHVGKSARV